ncbi:MAG: TetR/AcrR family transcriptional regulator, partial [Pseudonocardia sp.]|nr:TetR/AcrR family transcriptional regulator [Pseudonocardia sp.]
MTQVRGVARRTELFDELVALLLAEGFAHLTLDDLAARLRCSKRTLYALAGSKEQLVRAAVVHFFRGATERVEAAVAAAADPSAQVGAYLSAVAQEPAPASAAFFDDVAAFPPAAEVPGVDQAALRREDQQRLRGRRQVDHRADRRADLPIGAAFLEVLPQLRRWHSAIHLELRIAGLAGPREHAGGDVGGQDVDMPRGKRRHLAQGHG